MTESNLNIEYTPGATRDFLPPEWSELQELISQTQSVFADNDYLPVRTPTVEFRDVLALGGFSEALPLADLRDAQTRPYTLRTDFTVQIARLVSTRYSGDESILRFRYDGPCFQQSRLTNDELREIYQSGIELVGVGDSSGAQECLRLICQALDRVGLEDYKIGVGNANTFHNLLAGIDVSPQVVSAITYELATRDLVGLKREVETHISDSSVAETLIRCAETRGGSEVLDADNQLMQTATAPLKEIDDGLEEGFKDRLIYDLGLTSDRSYYTGELFEIYAAASNQIIGRGGRYDDLLEKFADSRPAIGFALDIEALHVAITEERS